MVRFEKRTTNSLANRFFLFSKTFFFKSFVAHRKPLRNYSSIIVLIIFLFLYWLCLKTLLFFVVQLQKNSSRCAKISALVLFASKHSFSTLPSNQCSACVLVASSNAGRLNLVSCKNLQKCKLRGVYTPHGLTNTVFVGNTEAFQQCSFLKRQVEKIVLRK